MFTSTQNQFRPAFRCLAQYFNHVPNMPCLSPAVTMMKQHYRNVDLSIYSRSCASSSDNNVTIVKPKRLSPVDVKIAQTAQNIFEFLESSKTLNLPLNLNLIEKVIKILYKHGVASEPIEAQLKETYDLLDYAPDKLDQLFYFFQQVGFESDVTWKNIILCPQLLNISLSKLETKYLAYAQFTIGDICQLSKIINKFPILYLENHNQIIGNVNWVLQLFPPAETVNLLRNCPSVLTAPSDYTYSKIEYINKVLGLDQQHIAKSQALDRSLLFIRCRVEFMKRSGLMYKHDMNKDRLSYKLGPSVNDLFDTSTSNYLSFVAKSTPEEYHVFCAMIEEELMNEVDYSDSDSSDSDSDDEDDVETFRQFEQQEQKKHRMRKGIRNRKT